ncbi:MAG: PEP-utilizing enzyme [Candidatus Woesearchaeota archaeon]
MTNKINWVKLVSNKHCPLYTYGAVIAVRDLVLKNTSINGTFLYEKSVSGETYLEQNELNKVMKRVKKHSLKDFEFSLDRCKEQGDKLLRLSLNLNKKNFDNWNLGKLRDEFSSYFWEYINMQSFLVTLNLIDWDLTKRVQNILKGFANVNDLFFNLSTPNKNHFNSLEQKDFLQIVLRIKQNNFDLNNLPSMVLLSLKNHSLKYGWINCRHFLEEPWGIDYFISRAKNVLAEDIHGKIEHLYKQLENENKKAEEIVKNLCLSKEESYCIDLFRESIYLRNHRKDLLTLSGFYVRPLLKEIAKRVGMEYFRLIYLTHEEIVQMLNLHINIEERSSGYTIEMINGKISIYNKELHEDKTQIELNFFKGDIANKGKVIGKVKIINHKKDLSKVKKGDIIVAGMTTPDHLIAMEQAAGFITDTGGVTCHAAIIAREMNKPCITGTKIATRVLKDNDLVELDADNGIVKKL